MNRVFLLQRPSISLVAPLPRPCDPQPIFKLLLLILLPCSLLRGQNLTGTEQSLQDDEWKRTNPDIVAYIPQGLDDGDNEHFLVFKAPKSDELLATWNQSSVEGRGDNRIALARSKDGISWSAPGIIAGRAPGRLERQASWPFPIVSKTGRIYCFYTKEIAQSDTAQMCGVMGCAFSDDNGHTWDRGADIVPPHSKYDNPDPSYPKNWIVWQKPVRDGRGHWIAGYTQWTSPEVIPKKSRNWPDQDSRCGFIRFENIDDGPAPQDLKVTWFDIDTNGIEVRHNGFPDISASQEPALVKLPDDRLFTVMRTMTGYIWYSVSDDGGETWRQPQVLRYRDGGEKVMNPIAPSPIYRLADGRFLLLFYNNDGRKGDYDQFKREWKGVNQVNYLRNPAYISLGEYRKRAQQPIWFSKPRIIADTNDVVFGPKKTASTATYPSLVEWKGKRILYYPDRKHYLLGKFIPDEMLSSMRVPEAP